jgi:hypothetical protein
MRTQTYICTYIYVHTYIHTNRIISGIKFPGPESPEKLQFIVRDTQLLVIDLVVYIAPRFWVIGLGEMLVKSVLARFPV